VAKTGENEMDESFREFLAALMMYVRVQDDQSICDERDAAARKLAALPLDRVLRLMESHDLAVIISGVTAVVSPSAIAKLKTLDSRTLREELAALAQAGSLPLAVVAGHPIGGMLVSMVDSIHGARKYREIAILLEEARTEVRIRPYLHHADCPSVACWAREPELSDERTDGTAEDPLDEEDDDDDVIRRSPGLAAVDD
jgi:hypothetical protein